MLASNITLNTKEYRLRVINPTSSLRSVSGLPFGTTRSLKTTTETTSKGLVNTAVIIEITSIEDANGIASSKGVISDRVMIKFSYDESVEHDYKANLVSALADITALLATTTNVDMLLNKEH